jgi:cytochrome c oxidase cbb3-type subunit 3
MGHADESDGIEEYDNPLPDWWLGLFWFTIIWAIGYTVHYHFIADRSQEARFEAEMAAAATRWPGEDASDVTFALAPENIEAGQKVFDTYCYVCHGANLEGGIGPSFLDEEWLHGGTPRDVIRTITEGVPEKGMAPWGPVLTAQEINDVAAFVLSRNAEARGISLDQVTQEAETPADSASPAGSGNPSEQGRIRTQG